MKNPSRKKRHCSFDYDDFVVRLSHLHDEVYPTNGHTVQPAAYTFFKESQKKAYLRKYVSLAHRANVDTRDVAIDTFISVQHHLRTFNIDRYPSESEARSSGFTRRDKLLLRARNLAHQILGELDVEEWFSASRHGPGTTVGVSYASTGMHRKWELPVTCTSDCAPFFELYFEWDETLKSLMQFRYPDLPFRNGLGPHLKIVGGSRLTTVPKNDETDRVIAVEPTANMFLQQGLGTVMADRLRSFGVDIELQQEVHRKMAFYGSCSRELATIDFRSASDCVRTDVVEFLLPRRWFLALQGVRSPLIEIDGGWFSPSCISSMGNATTFPLETLIFLCLACAVVSLDIDKTRSVFPLWDDFKNRVTVFGDDCILPTRNANEFMETCVSLGFLVNNEKSFFGSFPFRESCGADFLSGCNVRPVYLRAPRSRKPSVVLASLYVCFNRILSGLFSVHGPLKYVYYGWPMLNMIAQAILSVTTRIQVVPDNFPDDSGVKLAFDFSRLRALFPKRALPTIGVSEHGVSHFPMLRNVSSFEEECNDITRLWYKLKFPPTNLQRPSSPFDTVKKEAGYVVTYALDSGAFAVALLTGPLGCMMHKA